MPGVTRWLTTRARAIAPLMLKSSTQSLSTMPARFASSSEIQMQGPAAAQRQHDQVVGVGGVDPPLLVRRDEVEQDLGVAVAPSGCGCPRSS
jgi:hypothetical protein